MASPWERELGQSIELLHPRLREYFGEIPAGSVGRGIGVFDVVGTPRRWLWPALAILARRGVLFPVWQRDVRFRVENRAVAGEVRAARTFEFAKGARVMVDSVDIRGGVLSDHLGRHGRVRVALTASVDDGGLVLRSTGAKIAGIPIPRWCAPRLTLTERWDDSADCQRVALVLEAPLLGRLYEYAGTFTYEIETS